MGKQGTYFYLMSSITLLLFWPLVFVARPGIEIDKDKMIPAGQATCGLQCLYCLCKLQDIPVRMEDLLDTVPYTPGGTSMLHLKRAAENLGFVCRGHKVDPNELQSLPLPAIVHLNDLHYQLVVSFTPRTVKLIDPPSRLIEIPLSKFFKGWSGYVLTCTLPKPDPNEIRPSDSGDLVYIKDPHWNIGECASGKTYRHQFTLVNAGDEEIETLSTKTSCGCAVAEVVPDRIPPSSVARISVTLKTGGRYGEYVGRILVTTNNNEYATLMMDIHAYIKLSHGSLTAFPGKILWGEVLKGERLGRRLKLKRHGDGPLNFASTKCDIAEIDVAVVHDISEMNSVMDKYLEFDVLLDSSRMPLGPFEGELVILTNDEVDPTARVPISGTIVGELDAYPSSIFVSTQNTIPTEKVVTIKNKHNNPFQIQTVEITPNDFPAELECMKVNDSLWEIRLVFVRMVSKRITKGSIAVKTDSRDMPEILIPITIINH